MTEENEQNCNYVITSDLMEMPCRVRVCDIADAAGARQLRGIVEVKPLLPQFKRTCECMGWPDLAQRMKEGKE